MRHGEGKLSYASGATYKGSWKKNKKSGKGCYTSAVGVFEGQFSDGKREGKGRMKYNSGKFLEYNGRWKNNQWNGSGVLVFRAGGRWQGMFKDGVQHGKGVFFKDDKKAVHEYDTGKLVKVKVEDDGSSSVATETK